MSGGRLLPLFLSALFLSALAGALATLTGPRAYLPRVLLLGSLVSFLLFLYRGRGEILFLLVRARRVAEPGPAATWLLAAAVLLLGSALLERVPSRIDLTGRGLNSLSEASRAVLAAGEGTVELIAVYRETSPNRARAVDLLDIYRNASARVRVETLDPDRRPDRARALGLNRSGLILVRAEGATEKVAELTETEVTRAILRAENPGRVRLAFTTGHGERSIRDGGPMGLGKLATALRAAGYQPEAIGLVEEEIPDDAAIVAVIGPQRVFLPGEIEKLRGYLDGGGRLLLCLEPGQDAGLEGFLRDRGVLLDSLEVLDEGPATRGLGFGPRVVVVTDYPRSHPIGRSVVGYTVFPGIRSVALSQEVHWGIDARVLLQSGPFARLVPPAASELPDGKVERARRSLAVVEEWEVPGSGRAEPEEPVPEKPYARLLVVGDADWLTGSFLDLYANRELADRSFHWLAGREFLLRIPPLDLRGTSLRVGLTGLRTLFYLLQVALPLLLLGIGLWRWSRRR